MDWKRFIVIFGYLQSVGMTITMLIIFFNAYFNNYKTIVLINYFGEAHVEAVFFSIMAVFIFVGLFYAMRDLEQVKE